MSKSIEAFRTISEVAEDLDVPKHVLRFWEVKFPQIRPMKRGGGRRYYRPEDLVLLRGIQRLLHAEGYTIKGVQKILREHGVEPVKDQGLLAIAEQASAGKAGARSRATGSAASKVSAAPIGRVRPLAPVGRAASNAKPAGQASNGPLRASLEAAIRELKVCRDILTGSVTATASATPSVTRKAGLAR